MKLTYPHMGTLTIPIQTLLKGLGLEVIPPPPITDKTIQLGVKHSPEFACLPLKINVGNFIEAIENGADTIVMLGGVGPCRFGYYAEVEGKILINLDYDFEMIVIEPPAAGIHTTLKALSRLRNGNHWSHIFHQLTLAYNKVKALDKVDIKAAQVRPRAEQKHLVEDVVDNFRQSVQEISDLETLRTFETQIIEELDLLAVSSVEPPKLALVGEIYMVLENTANMQLEKTLGHLGLEVERGIYLHQWILDHIVFGTWGVNRKRRVQLAAQPYISRFIGGHGQESVGEAVIKAQQGYDGALHLLPFTCTPEIVAQSVMTKVSRDYAFPILTVILDEHQSEVGLRTRLEAFADLLQQKNTVKDPKIE